MNSDIYMKIQGIEGESQDANHKGWIAISSFDWGATQPANNQGGSTGRVEYQDLHVHTMVDKATPAIMRYMSNGKPIKKVEISTCLASEGQLEYLRITLEDVLITAANYQGNGHGAKVAIDYKFQAGKVRQQYWETASNGSKGAESASGWDIRKQCDYDIR
ncbi:type VI secretion system tube protein Hcp [Erwiniaceae bacterium BAC15a-03b]|uniref:Type VI secretion system tube protein Hcp n=1 Tax=Winslowiella arboricola TaxID=2978220 RepID=A0A9J6PM08_9GAMM|nr:type VI secretion system tube protein Hcp [Winslowiella arboricola]MCU5771837.1 type VI secretion system tube protein Hcp [Winslowiella arboricola]MCU5777467.1 type VI secretion system tube protein Hcp [Winslowiella arboricola]